MDGRIVVVKRDSKKCHKMTEETAGKVGLLLDEIPLVPGELGIKLAFNLKEVARESDSTLDAYENFSGPLKHRAPHSRGECKKDQKDARTVHIIASFSLKVYLHLFREDWPCSLLLRECIHFLALIIWITFSTEPDSLASLR
jgi:hypothetical protein